MVLAFVTAVQIIQQLKLMLGGGKLSVFPSNSFFVVCFVLFFLLQYCSTLIQGLLICSHIEY